jgi:uncharacterized delta-60 repeat protein
MTTTQRHSQMVYSLVSGSSRGLRVVLLLAAVLVAGLLGPQKATAAAGDLDPSFGNGGTLLADVVGGTTAFCCRVAAYPGGKVLALAHFQNNPTVSVMRFDSDGSLDRTFNPAGPMPGIASVTFGAEVSNQPDGGAIAVDSAGRVVVTEELFVSNNPTLGIARLTPGGAPDSGFSQTGTVQSTLGFTDAIPGGVTVLPDNSVMVGALVTDSGRQRVYAARFASDGAFDPSFGEAFDIGSNLLAPLVTSDGHGRFLLAGAVTGSGQAAQFQYVARLGSSGRLDPTFNPAGSPAGTALSTLGSSAQPTAIAAAADGRPVVASLRFPSGQAQPVLDRYTLTGLPDSTFGSNGIASLAGLTGTFLALALAGDGSWLVGGTQDAKFLVAHLSADGQPDGAFSAGRSAVTTAIGSTGSSSAESILADANGRILAVGVANDNSSTNVAMARYLGAVSLATGGGGSGAGGGASGGAGGGSAGGSGGVPSGHGSAAFTGPPTTTVGSRVLFDGSASSLAGAAISHYQWYVNGRPSAICEGNTSQLQTRFFRSGTDTVSLHVTDMTGLVTTASHTITVRGVGTGRANASAASATGARALLTNSNQVYLCVHAPGDPLVAPANPGLPHCATHVSSGVIDAEGCLFESLEQVKVHVTLVSNDPKPIYFSDIDQNQPLAGDPLPDSERRTLLGDLEAKLGVNPTAWICKNGTSELKQEFCSFLYPPQSNPPPSVPPAGDASAHPAATPGGIPTSLNSGKNVALDAPCPNGLSLADELPSQPGVYYLPQCVDIYASDQPVRINGLEYRPAPGSDIVVVPQFDLVISSGAEIYLGPAKLKPVQSINYLLPHGIQALYADFDALNVPDVKTLLAGEPQAARDELGSVAGLPTSGGLHVSLGDFTAEITLHTDLPPIFSDGNGGPVSVEVHAEISNTSGFQVIEGYLGSVNPDPPDSGLTVDLGPIQLRNFGVCFRHRATSDPYADPCPAVTGIQEDPSFGDDFWDASGNVMAGPVSIFFRGPAPAGCYGVDRLGIGLAGTSLKFAGAGIDNPFRGGNISFDRLDLGLTSTDTFGKFAGCAEFSAGFGLVSLDGTVFAVWTKNGNTYQFNGSELPGLVKTGSPPSYPYTNDFAIGVGGDLGIKFPIVGRISVGNGYILYSDSPGAVFFGGGFKFSIPSGHTYDDPPDNGIAIGGGVSGAIGLSSGFPPPFYLEGEVNAVVNLFGASFFHTTGGAAIADDPVTKAGGIGVCGPVSIAGATETLGLGYHWGDGVLDVIEHDLHYGSCDFLPEFRINVQAADVASAAAAGPTTVRVPAGSPAVDVYVTGQGGAPDVTMTGPRRITATTGGIAPDQWTRTGQFLLQRATRLHQTLVMLLHPVPGRYRITANPGSVPITGVEQSNGIEPAVSARVTGRRGRRELDYRIKPEPGQIVTFLEADAGHVTRALGHARGPRGTITFTASPGRRRRQIVAQITENRAPVQNMTVAAYTPPRLRRLSRVHHLQVRRAGANATVTFAEVPGARDYLVSLVMNDGARRLYRTTRHRLVVRGLFLEVPGRITVRAEGDSTTTLTGPGTRATVPSAIHYRRSRKPTRRHG